MTALSTCLRRAGNKISSDDRELIVDAAKEYRADGMSAADAAQKAVDDAIEAARSDLADLSAEIVKRGGVVPEYKSPTPPKKPKKAPKLSTVEAAEAELEARLPDLNLSTEKETAYRKGWTHVIDGGTLSNLADKSLDVRAGYDAAMQWLKDTGRHVTRKKQGGTGTQLRRWYELFKKAKQGTTEKDLKDMVNSLARPTILPDALIEEGATNGVKRILEDFRKALLPFTEYAGRKAGGGRRRWNDSFSEALEKAWNNNPDEVKRWAQEYADLVSDLATVFDGNTTVQQVQDAYDKVMVDKWVAKERPWDKKKYESPIYTETGLKSLGTDGTIFRRTPVGMLKHSYFYEERRSQENMPLDEGRKRAKPMSRPRLDVIRRDGFKTDRNGKNISSKKLKDAFGFKDITIGQYVTASEEQDHLNYAYDAFMDLAETLGIKPKDISLNGWLYFSIGALGHGGKHAAHFSPNQPRAEGTPVAVINVTKTKGDGSLAHEWGHALDYYLRNPEKPGSTANASMSPLVNAAVKKMSRRLITTNEAQKDLERFITGGWFYQGSKRELPTDRAFRRLRLMPLEKKTDYLSDAEALDKAQGRGRNPYWSKPEELFARATEAYAFDVAPGTNDYLVSPWVEEGFASKENGYKGRPYPAGDDRALLKQVFDFMFEQIEWTDDGPRIKSDFQAETDQERAEARNDLRKKLTQWIENRSREIKREKAQKVEAEDAGWRGGSELARAFYMAIVNDELPADNNKLRDFVAKHDEVNPGDVEYSRLKEAQEDLEAAIVQRARHLLVQTHEFRSETGTNKLADDQAWSALMNLYNKQPSLNLQTSTSAENQAYSTPVPIAYIASRLAGITQKSRVYEPTAGNGMLLIDKEMGGNIVANEVDDRRADALADGFGGSMRRIAVTRRDATEALPGKMAANYDVVIMNPPFGSLDSPVTIGEGYKISKIDHLIAANSLVAMKENGRAVLILGADKKAGEINSVDRPFFNWLYSNYNVIEAFEVSGDLYKKQGAGWPIRMLVIDGRRTASTDQVAPERIDRRINSYEELYRHFESIRDRVVVPEPAQSGQAGRTGGASAEGEAEPGGGGVPGTAGQPDRGAGEQGEPGAGAGTRGGRGAGTGGTGVSGGGAVGAGGAGGGITGGRTAGTAETEGEAAGAGGRGNEPGGDTGGPDLDAADFSDDDFNDLLDEVIGETTTEPAVTATKKPTQKAKPKKQATEKPAEKTGAEHLKEAGESAKAMFGDAVDGLDALFGDPGKFSSGLTFDEETYAKAKPHFVSALENALKTANSLKEAFRAFIKFAVDRWGAAIKPYLQRFKQDIDSDQVRIRTKSELQQSEGHQVNEFQSTYVGKSNSPSGTILTPANQAQSVEDALNNIEERYGDIDQFVAKELGYGSVEEMHGDPPGSKLGGMQVDGVAMAINQIKNGGALIIGDQTGVGKGRQAASMIRWAIRNNLTPIFITAKPDLYTDMWDDLQESGTTDVRPFLTNVDRAIIDRDATTDPDNPVKLFGNKMKTHKKDMDYIINNAELPEDRNALFTTYDQINTENKRRDAIMALAPRALFILDEAHKAAGDSGRGEFLRGALELSGKAVYLSATYAKRPDNMPLYFLTDMSKAADTIDALIAAVNAGGVPFMEMVSNQLTRAGQFVRRERSWDGISIPTYIDPDIEQQQRDEEAHDAVTERLRAIVAADIDFHENAFPAIRKALIEQGESLNEGRSGNKAGTSVNHTNFTAVVHNALAQLMMAIKAERTADMAIEALKRNEKPIIAMNFTMGSFLEEYQKMMNVKPGDTLEGFDYRVVLGRLLRRTRRISVKDKFGNAKIIEVPLEDLPFSTQELYREAMALIQELDAGIPASPIDMIRHRVEKAGYSVKEITGRSRRVEYRDGKPPRLVTMDRAEKKDRVGTVSQFNNGDLDVLIMNEAGSTGISMHASTKFTDKRQRRMIVAQAALDINVFMQMLGRINRTGQVELPLYTVFSSSLPAEKRPQAVLSDKMKKLNANTSSNDTSATSVNAVDIINKYGDEVIARYLDEHPEIRDMVGVSFDLSKDPPQVQDVAKKTTGRMALLPVRDQQLFYDQVEAEYQEYIEFLTENGRNDLIARTLPFAAELIEEQVLDKGSSNKSALTADAMLGKYAVRKLNIPPTPQEVKAEIKRHLQGKTPDQIVDEFEKEADEHNENVIVPRLQAAVEKAFSALSEAEQGIAYPTNFRTGEREYREIAGPQGKPAEAYNRAVRHLAHHIRTRNYIKESLRGRYRVGSKITLKQDDEVIRGMVVGMKPRWKPGDQANPYVMSGFTINVRLNGGTGRANLPMSRLETMKTGSFVKDFDVDELFEKASDQVGSQREVRYIATNNLLRAYGKLTSTKAEIARFTMADGRLMDGIILPKKFDVHTGIKQEIRFPDALAAQRFLQDNSNNSTVNKLGLQTSDQSLRIRPVYGQSHYEITVVGSKAKGGKWWLNKALIGLVDGEFAGTRSLKSANVREEKLPDVLELIYKTDPLYALPSMKDLARPYLDIDESPGGEPRLSRTEPKPAPSGLYSAQVQETVAAVTRNWKGAPKIVVVQAPEGLPTGLRSYVEGQGAMNEVAGAYNPDDGSVYLVADNLRGPGAVERTILHEVIGHYGLRKAFGDEIVPLLKRVAMANPAGLREIAGRYDLDITDIKQRMVAAEELLAKMAESGERMKFMDRVIAFVRDWLRKHGFVHEFTDNDLRAILAKSGRAVRGGYGGTSSVGNSLLSRSQADVTNTPEFNGWFGDSKIVNENGEPLVVYHGTRPGNDIKEFELPSFSGDGIYFTPDPDYADGFTSELYGESGASGAIYPVYLSIKNPYVVDAKYDSNEWNNAVGRGLDREKLKDQGYDGVILKDSENGEIDQIIAFEPEQIKSAVGNRGTFDSTNPDIRLSRKRVMGTPEQESAIESAIAKGTEDITFSDRIKGFLGKIRDIDALALRQGIIDEFAAIEAYEREQYGSVPDAAVSASKAARRTKNLDSVMAVVINYGTLEYRGGTFQVNPDTKGFAEIFEEVSRRGLLHLWEGWAAANRAQRLMSEGREHNFTQEQIDELLKLEDEHRGENGENLFRRTLDEYQQFNREILDLAESVGVIDAEARAMWERNDYIPFYRAFEDELTGKDGVKGPRGKGGIQGQRSGIRKLTGGEEKIGNVIENMVMNAAHLIDASFKNIAMRRTVDIAEGVAMERVEPAWQPVNIDTGQMVSKLRKAGVLPDRYTADEVFGETGVRVGQLTTEERKEYQRLFRRTAPQGGDIVSVMVDGKPQYYRVSDPLLLRAVTSMGTSNVEGLMRLFRGAKKLLTKAVTADPAFMVANFLRDTLSTFVVSDANLTPVLDAAKGFRKALKDDPALIDIMAAGGGGGGFYHQTPAETRKHLAYQLKAMEDDKFRGTILNSPSKIWSFWQKIGGAAENANRIAIFERVLAAGGTKAEAVHQAQDILNFTQRGDFAVMRFLTEVVPFMNARIQGLDRLYRGAKQDPRGFMLKGMMLAGASMALLAVNGDEEEYDELPEWDKDTYWHFFVGPKDASGHSEHHFRLPKPFEVGAIFGTIPERMAMTLSGKGSGKLLADRMGRMFLDTFALDPTPQLVKPIVEQYANRVAFTGRPIVGLGLSNLMPEGQYNPWTSTTMREIAQLMPDWAPAWLRSPVRLESAMRGYVGTIGMYVLSASDMVVRESGDYPAPPERTLGDVPVIKRFVRDRIPVSTKYGNQFYDMVTQANEVYRTIKQYRQQGRFVEARELLSENRGKLGARKLLNRNRNKITSINNRIKLIYDNRKMSPGEKRRRIDKLVQEKQRLFQVAKRFESDF